VLEEEVTQWTRYYPGASESSHFSTACPVYRVLTDRQIHARRPAATIVRLRHANLGRDYSQADRIDLSVQVVAYRDHSDDGQSHEIVAGDFHAFRQDFFSSGGGDISNPRELGSLSKPACL
jgi:hypothetical protein